MKKPKGDIVPYLPIATFDLPDLMDGALCPIRELRITFLPVELVNDRYTEAELHGARGAELLPIDLRERGVVKEDIGVEEQGDAEVTRFGSGLGRATCEPQDCIAYKHPRLGAFHTASGCSGPRDAVWLDVISCGSPSRRLRTSRTR